MASTPIARSPYPNVGATRVEDGWEISSTSGGDFTISDLSRLAKWTVRAPHDGPTAASLPTAGKLDRAEGRLRIGGAPGDWLILAAPGQDAGVVPVADDFVSVVDVTHGRALLRITGAASTELFSKICAINLGDRLVPDGSWLRTSIAHIVTDLARDDVGGIRSYLLHSERSASGSLLTGLLEAGAEFGVTFIGAGPAIP